MPIQPSRVTSRANSDLLQIARLAEMRHLPSAERVRRIWLIARDFGNAVEGCTHDPIGAYR